MHNGLEVIRAYSFQLPKICDAGYKLLNYTDPVRCEAKIGWSENPRKQWKLWSIKPDITGDANTHVP